MHDQTIADVITLKSIYSIDPAVCVKLPSYQIHNELDQHILAELHQTIATVNQSLTNYRLDDAVRSAI